MAGSYSLSVTTPIITLSKGFGSKWLAAHNPTIYSFTRVDAMVTGITLRSGIECVVEIPNIGATWSQLMGATNNRYCYLKTPKYDGIYKVINIAYSGAYIALIEIPDYYEDEVAISGSVYSSYRWPLYYIDIKLNTYQSGHSALQEQIELILNSKGYAKIDLSERIKLYLDQFTANTFAVDELPDNTLAQKYDVVYEEKGTGISVSPTTSSIMAVNASRQIGDSGGNNMRDYVVHAFTTAPANKAKFLTDFDIPTIFIGYPFALGYINDALLIISPAINLERAITLYDRSGATIGTTTKSLPLADTTNVDKIVTLVNGNALTSQYDGYSADIWLKGSISSQSVVLTELKKIKIVQPCSNRGYFFIRWLNKEGFYNFWCFERVIKNKGGASSERVYKPVDALENSPGYYSRQNRDIEKTVTCIADFLTLNEYECLGRIPATAQFYEGGKWYNCSIADSDFQADQIMNRYSMEITFELQPEILQSW